jgi:hypothetical protein
MFFFGSINSILSQQGHDLPTANQRTRASMQEFNYVATNITLVYFQFLSHFHPPLGLDLKNKTCKKKLFGKIV